MSYRHIPSCTVVGDRVSAHHYINESRPASEQFMLCVNWETMTVHVKVLSDGQFVTVSVTPVNATSPARES